MRAGSQTTPIGSKPARQLRGKSNAVDAHVGNRVRIRRALLGMTQEKLADAIGLAFQQIQKYDRGANRISASRLFDIASVLEVPVSFFFEDLPEDLASLAPGISPGPVSIPPRSEGDPLARRETLELVRAYYRISDPRVRKTLVDLIRNCVPA